MAGRSQRNPKPPRRARGEQIQAAILETAFDELLGSSFRAVSIESIAAKTGVAKTTIYRRWPNKAALVMEAFLGKVSPAISFPKRNSHLESIRAQMTALAKVFRGPAGAMAKSLLGEAQFDAELAEAFRERWIAPRRDMARASLQAAIQNGELRPNLDLDETLDALYGGLYYRLMIGSGPITDAYVEGIFSQVTDGLRPQKR